MARTVLIQCYCQTAKVSTTSGAKANSIQDVSDGGVAIGTESAPRKTAKPTNWNAARSLAAQSRSSDWGSDISTPGTYRLQYVMMTADTATPSPNPKTPAQGPDWGHQQWSKSIQSCWRREQNTKLIYRPRLHSTSITQITVGQGAGHSLFEFEFEASVADFLLGSLLDPKVQSVHSFETSVGFLQTRHSHVTENDAPHIHRYENIKFGT